MGHTTYGLQMEHGTWQASCGCGWRSTPSAVLAEQVDELDGHLRCVVTAQQRPSRLDDAVHVSVLRLVDHTSVVGVLALCLIAAGPLMARRRAA